MEKQIKFFQLKRKGLSKRQIARFCSQLKMLLSSGVPLLEALRIVRNITRHKDYEELIQQISEGESLAQAMVGHFPPMVTSSIESAERVGSLEETLGRLSKYYEERAEVEDKIKSSLVYPSFVMILCLFSLIILFAFVLPGFKNLFMDLDTDLPLLSRIIIEGGELLSRVWYVPLLTVLLLSVLVSGYRKTESGALRLDRCLLKVKSFSREQIVQGFRTLGSLLEGGVSIVSALKDTARASRNRAFKNIVFEVKEAIENGEKLSQALAEHKIFPGEIVQMIAVGENSGRLGEMLVNISNFYEKEKELFIKRFTAMLEPALTLMVGLVVGVIAIAMFLPMISMISKLN
jgi:type II secretory pathway component PulF